MASKSLRRLAADHRSLATSGLPPNYLYPPNADDSDLSSLDVLLTGPTGTPYANGVWRLHLDIPPNYPTAPPTATFRTRLWHPNIDESTGAVCVETLKRDWSSSLKLRDVLVTISCLLIQPNPASALNEAAGKLASEDWDGFCRRAKLMTEIHAAVPKEIADEVREAQSRGEEKEESAGTAVAAVPPTLDHGKDKTKVSPNAVTKLHQSSTDDEENRKRRGDTVEIESDPESDWIPGPLKSPKGFAAGVDKDNIFGIKGLDAALDFETPLKKIIVAASGDLDQPMDDNSDPFILVSPKHPNQHSFSLRAPQAPPPFVVGQSSISTPNLTSLSHPNPFSAIQLEDQPHPLLKEFSWSWQDSEILKDTGTIKDGPTKAEVRKRLASNEFEAKQEWEMKKFKTTGYDLAKYNRGEFGPRTGIWRL
ncbi:ubiquitin-conjugating enzyme/RWD-like protein [Dendryphion nanum]|uniref:Ubiquitin-conjugating enzyme/RWD-like protein n=1 Tax=Dendryphion nanum TaxID=256645 RepID=A0A9P9IC91_9PLEO|nr:ubiquitin-conjugating enzyme/RWD-like protein [Dendryphion nanum]